MHDVVWNRTEQLFPTFQAIPSPGHCVMQTVTMSDDTADCSANVPRNRALSSKLKAYIALLETAPSSDIQRLLSTEPDFEDDFSKREVSPVRTRPIEETVGDGTVFTIMGTGVHGFDGSVSGSPMGLRTTSPEAVLSARTEQVTQPQRKRSRSPGRRSGPGAAFDEATQAAVEGNTLIGATNDREQREAKDAAELLVLRGGVVTEVEKSQRRSVDLRKQGNLNMYEADVLKQRRNIMDSPYLQVRRRAGRRGGDGRSGGARPAVPPAPRSEGRRHGGGARGGNATPVVRAAVGMGRDAKRDPPPRGCIGTGGAPAPSRAPSLCPASMAFVTDTNRPQLLWQPPPTACLPASRAASEVPSRLMHPCPPPPPTLVSSAGGR